MSDAERAIRVVLADDHTLFRKGLAILLDRDSRINVIGQAADGREAVQMVQALRPDLALLDVRLPKMSGLEAGREILSHLPKTKIVYITGLESETHATEALALGANGYLAKDAEPDAVISAIVGAMHGSFTISIDVARRAFAAGSAAVRRDAYDGISARELEILKLTASGLAPKQIARRLNLSEKTVRNHTANIYEKLGIHDRSQALLYAVRKGLVDPTTLEASPPVAV